MRTLSLSAIRVMHRLEIEHMRHGGAENGRLIVTHEQFAAWGIAQNAIAPAIRELVALGFVEITEKGCGGNENQRRASRFRLTYVNTKNREQPTHEWRKIETIEDAERLGAEARGEKDRRARDLGRLGLRALKNKIPVTENVSGAGHTNSDLNADFPVTENVTTRPVTSDVTTIYNLGGHSVSVEPSSPSQASTAASSSGERGETRP